MNRYEIRCTEEQTRKALELGAPIEKFDVSSIEGEFAYNYPTTGEIMGWLEDQGIQISIMFSYQVSPIRWNYDLDNNNIILFEHNSMGYSTRKEAILAAIDAALNYLTNNKK